MTKADRMRKWERIRGWGRLRFILSWSLLAWVGFCTIDALRAITTGLDPRAVFLESYLAWGAVSFIWAIIMWIWSSRRHDERMWVRRVQLGSRPSSFVNLIRLLCLFYLAVIASWAVPSPQEEPDKAKRGIEQVIEFAKGSGLAEHITDKLEARLESYPKLPSVVLCRVSQSPIVSHPASWVLGFVGAESFRLGGFGKEIEFDRMAKRLRLEIKDGDAAISQVQMYIDLVFSDPNFEIVHNRKQLRPMVEGKFSWAGKNAKKEASKWMAGVPPFVLKRLESPTAFRYESTGDYIVHLFALRQSPYDLRLHRYEFRVEADGNVVLEREIRLNVADWE